MKRIFILFFAMMLALPAFAEGIDLSSMTTEDLLSLKNQINAILIERTDLWKEVRVPAGIWEVGVHIPAGHWTIVFDDPECDYGLFIRVGTECVTTAYGTMLTGERDFYFINNKSKSHFTSDVSEIDLILTNGQYVEIERDYVMFSPYGAVRDLGFDW